MSTESATAFVEKMKTDDEFARRVGEADSKEDRWAILKANGFDFTQDELQAHHNALDGGTIIATRGSVLRSHECVCCAMD